MDPSSSRAKGLMGLHSHTLCKLVSLSRMNRVGFDTKLFEWWVVIETNGKADEPRRHFLNVYGW